MRAFKILLLIVFISVDPLLMTFGLPASSSKASSLQLSTFEIDVTPPMGYQMAYNPVIKTYDMGLRAKGVIVLGAGQPIVLVAVDWITIANESHDEFTRILAEAAGTIPQRVAIHCLHQHDSPRGEIQSDFVKSVLQRLAMEARNSLSNPQPVTHIAVGEAQVNEVASNRRILGPDGKVRVNRMSSCLDPAVRAEPEGLIDPMVTVLSFWNMDKPVAVLSFYATHPQSYYRLGVPNPDYPGIARFYRQLEVPDALHVHFTAVSGNIAAGKYNDGSHEMRGILAERLADGMKRAYESGKKEPVTANSIKWIVEPVALPPDPEKSKNSIYEQRFKAGRKINIQCLSVSNARLFFMPGDPFIEYQLAAKKARPDLLIAMASHGDGGPGYIPTAIGFKQGGYEAGVTSGSRLLPNVEKILTGVINKILNEKP